MTTVTATFESVNPAGGDVIATFPVCGDAEVRAAVEKAASAASWWVQLGWAGRRARLLAWKSHLTRHIDDIAKLVHEENGKPLGDAQLEMLLSVLHLDWAAKNARKVLGPRRQPPGMAALNQAATLEYQPLGVVGVIGPWNYPVFTPMGSIVYALAAGNSVVFKPSEYTPAIGQWLVESFAEFTGGVPVLQLVTGSGDTGEALIRAGVDKVAFTGSSATARKVMAACAENLTPLVAEGGGKDAFIVDADADLDAAADAAIWGAFSNAGQSCLGVERIYAVSSVYEGFMAKLTERAAKVRPGADARADYGPMTMPSQIDVIEQHVTDALTKGGTAVIGGREAIRKPFVEPIILAEVPDDSCAITEETFGPVITVAQAADLDDAVRQANASRYGLGATVFAADKKRAMAAARQLRTGMTSINAVIAYAAIPRLPFGGIRDSGFGRIHGADGLREFARPKAITRQRFRVPVNLTSFARTDAELNLTLRLVRLLHARQPTRTLRPGTPYGHGQGMVAVKHVGSQFSGCVGGQPDRLRR